MRILHTSDWHIGKALFQQSRKEDFTSFLNWLHGTIVEKNVDTLLVSGDVFDTNFPSNDATDLYYEFLARLVGTCCRNVIITSGNHDSPHTLESPSPLMRHLGIHVIGNAPKYRDNAEEGYYDSLILDFPEAVFCAIPYLKEGMLHVANVTEGEKTRDMRVKEAVVSYYQAVGSRARDIANGRPVIGMGHLYARREDSQGAANGLVGTLGEVDLSSVSGLFDYLALGHLHVPLPLDARGRVRYSGSPLPLRFHEQAQQKQVVLVKTTPDGIACPEIIPVDMGIYRYLDTIRGDLDELLAQIREHTLTHPGAFLEAVHTGDHYIPALVQMLEQAIAEAAEKENVQPLRLLRTESQLTCATTREEPPAPSLKELTVDDVINRFFEERGVDDSHTELFRSFLKEIRDKLPEQKKERPQGEAE